MSANGWEVFNVEDLKADTGNEAVSYTEFLNVPGMHCGVYRLAAGSKDMQTPHDEDEVYYVVEGRAQLRVAGETTDVGPGSVLYVRASEEHAFFEISEDMLLLVFFSRGN